MPLSTPVKRMLWLLVGSVLVFGSAIWYVPLYFPMVSFRMGLRVNEGENTVITMSEITNFRWDRMFVFGPYTYPQLIHDRLGFYWSDAQRTRIQHAEGICLVIFVLDQRVVHWFEHSRHKGDLIELQSPNGYTPEEAIFVVRTSPDRRFVLRPALSQ